MDRHEPPCEREGIVRILICVFALVGSFACSESPTSPSRSPAVAGQLRWDVVSPSCAPATPPTPQPGFSTASIAMLSGTSLTASWPYQQNGREVTLYAHFVRENGGWAMCSWDTADV